MPYNEGCGGLCGGVRASCPYMRNLAMMYSSVRCVGRFVIWTCCGHNWCLNVVSLYSQLQQPV
jgi:hypothetical protein